MFDGIQRPLDAFMKAANSAFLSKGVEVKSLNREKKWPFVPTAKVGDKVSAGDVIGTVQETAVVLLQTLGKDVLELAFGPEGVAGPFAEGALVLPCGELWVQFLCVSDADVGIAV